MHAKQKRIAKLVFPEILGMGPDAAIDSVLGMQLEATTDASSSRAKPKSVALPSPAPSSDTHQNAPQRNSAKPPQSVDASPTGNQDGQCPGGEQLVVPKAPAKTTWTATFKGLALGCADL